MSDRVAAAVEVAGRLALRVGDPVVVRDMASTLVLLRPFPVLARVWPTGRRDPGVVDYELAATAYLAEQGAPVAPPYDAVAHVVGKLTVTLWQQLDHDPERPLDGSAAGQGLRVIHELLASPGAPDASRLPHFARLEQATDVVAALRVTDEDRAGLEELLELARTVLPTLDLPLRPLHGDAWLGNVLRTPAGPVWSDFELACRGPLVADLGANEVVSEHRGRRDVDDAFLAGYGDVDREAVAALIPLALVPFAAWTFRLAGERSDLLPAARWRLARALNGLRAQVTG